MTTNSTEIATPPRRRWLLLPVGIAAALTGLGAGPCHPDGGTLHPIGDAGFKFTRFAFDGPTTIKNGESAQFKLRAEVERHGYDGDITAGVEIDGSAGAPPLHFEGALADGQLTISSGHSAGSVELTLRCEAPSPPPPFPATLRGNRANSKHGVRTVIDNPPCPPRCGTTPVTPCPPGCGGTTTHDDPVNLNAGVVSSAPLADPLPTGDSVLSVVCVP